jgi:D-lactate dehydrogenase (cytochrome)
VDEEDLRAHGYSEWSSVNLDTLPVAVAYPRNTEDVSTIAQTCHKWHVPIVPYSGGSSIEGHTSAPFGGISVDFMHMDKIITVNADDLDVVVQPSVCWTDLNTQLKQMGVGLFFPIDPGQYNNPQRKLSYLSPTIATKSAIKLTDATGQQLRWPRSAEW